MIVTAILSIAYWGAEPALGLRRYLHIWDLFHYYLGAKYFQEVRYDGLYLCVAAADIEDGLGAQVGRRSIRDLRGNDLRPGWDLFADAAQCRARFTPPRWDGFKADVAYFRAATARLTSSAGNWDSMQADHGFNASPAWSLAATTLAEMTSATDRELVRLSLVDLGLLAGMWIVAWRAFGWRGTCAAVIFWGTNHVARYGWTAASLLRHDWLAFTVAGISLLRLGRPFVAGMVLTHAALLRVFPIAALPGLAMGEAARAFRTRQWRVSRKAGLVFLGSIASVIAVAALSWLVGGAGPRVWREFAKNTTTHASRILSNDVGLVAALTHQQSTRLAAFGMRREARRRAFRPGDVAQRDAQWEAARRERMRNMTPLLMALAVAYLAALAWSTSSSDAAGRAILGLGLIPVLGKLSGYYYSFLLCFGLLATSRPAIGILLCALSAVTRLGGLGFENPDDQAAWNSAAIVTFIVVATILVPSETVVLRAPRQGELGTSPCIESGQKDCW